MMDMAAAHGDDANAVFLKAGETRELVWRFGKAGRIEFACNVPGHYEAGMKGTVSIRGSQATSSTRSHAPPSAATSRNTLARLDRLGSPRIRLGPGVRLAAGACVAGLAGGLLRPLGLGLLGVPQVDVEVAVAMVRHPHLDCLVEAPRTM